MIYRVGLTGAIRTWPSKSACEGPSHRIGLSLDHSEQPGRPPRHEVAEPSRRVASSPWPGYTSAMVATRLDRRITAADIDALPHEWDTRYELVGGVLLMSRKPPFEHQLVISRLDRKVGPAADAVGGLGVPEPGIVWEDDGDDNVAPDFVILLRTPLPKPGEKLRTCPDIVVEVVSAGEENRRRDYVAKRELYWRRGAQEYWILDLERREILRLVRGSEGWTEQLLRPGNRLTTPLLAGWEGVDVADLFA